MNAVSAEDSLVRLKSAALTVNSVKRCYGDVPLRLADGTDLFVSERFDRI